MSEDGWLAAYLSYNGHQNQFLGNVVKPLVDRVLDEGLSGQFHFVRSYSRGPAIRLRFRGDHNVLEERLKPLLIEYFVSFFKKNPSTRIEPPYIQNLPVDKQWYPNNSILFVDYTPDIRFYGGGIGLELGFNQFEISSRIILEILEENSSLSYEAMIGLAIQLHLAFSYAVGMDREEMEKFYYFIFQKWFPYAYGHDGSLSDTEVRERRDITQTVFEDNFSKLRPSLFKIFEPVVAIAKEQQSSENEWINVWIRKNAGIVPQLTYAESNNALVFAERPQPGDYDQINTERLRLWPSFDVYVHMTNNRLDILKRDEAYIAYLIYKSLIFL